jgi:hypothetical protein
VRGSVQRAAASGRENPMIVVDQPDALIDQPIAIALRGFTPRQPVKVTATQTYADAVRWQSNATFVSDDDGQVDVTRRPGVTRQVIRTDGLVGTLFLPPRPRSANVG